MPHRSNGMNDLLAGSPWNDGPVGKAAPVDCRIETGFVTLDEKNRPSTAEYESGDCFVEAGVLGNQFYIPPRGGIIVTDYKFFVLRGQQRIPNHG